MDRENLNIILKQVIHEARELKIPVPDCIMKEVYINARPKKRFGCCHKKDGRFIIEISEFVLSCREEDIRGILAHEILHTCKGCSNHGPQWKNYAARMNQQYGYQIKRASSFEELGITGGENKASDVKIRYIVKCTKCGKEYPRQRYTCVMKKINAYRCQCGGKLIIIHNKEVSR